MPGTLPRNILGHYYYSPPLEEEMRVHRHGQGPIADKWQVSFGPGLVLPAGHTLLPDTLHRAMTVLWLSHPPLGGTPSPLTPGCWWACRQDRLVWGVGTTRASTRASSRVILSEATDELKECSICKMQMQRPSRIMVCSNWVLCFACLSSQKSQCEMIQPPDFDGTASGSREVWGSVLYSGSYSGCIWLECKWVELEEGLETKVKSWKALLFSLKRLDFVL